MMRIGTICGVLLVVLGVSGNSLSDEKILVDGVAARVNGDIVTIGEVLIQVAPIQQRLVQQFSGVKLKDELEKAYNEALTSIIERKLIIQAYEKQDMKIPDWVIDERLEDIINDSFKGDRSELMTVLARDRMTYEEWREEWKDRIIVSSMRGSFVGQKIKIAPLELRDKYNANTDKYKDSDKVKLRMMFFKDKGSDAVKESTMAFAGTIINRLKGGESFSELATKYSDGSRAEDGGDWGWVEPKILRKELADTVAEQKPGTVSNPIETKEGVYIVLLEDRKAAKTRKLEEVQAEIEEELRAEKAEDVYRDWVKRLKRDAFVEIVDKNIF